MFTPASCNILPRRVKSKRQHPADAGKQNVAVGRIEPDYTARRLLADNVRRLMGEHEDKSSVPKLRKVCYWPAGKKKGKRVSERNLRNVLAAPETDPPSPTLDVIIAIANAFDVPVWQLFADARLLKLWNLGKLFTISEGISDAEVEKHLPFPPRESARGPSSKKGKEDGHG